MTVNNSGIVAVPLENEFDFSIVPVSALSHRTKSTFSLLLNPVKEIPTNEGYRKDWRGLVDLIDLPVEDMPMFGTHSDPTAKILLIWGQNAMVQELLNILEKIDRWDVIDYTRDMIVEDLREYHRARLQPCLPLEQPLPFRNNFLTGDDVIRNQQGLGVQIYDAFVLYAEEDVDFAEELIEKMENYSFKLCCKPRLLGGISLEHEAILQLISERCNRLIIIFSPAFIESPLNRFFTSFAQMQGIEKNRNKIIPCFYKRCVIPTLLTYYFSLDYQKSGRLYNFWEKLRQTLSDPITNDTTIRRRTVSTVAISEFVSPRPSAPVRAIKPPPRQSSAPKSINLLTVNNNHNRTRSESSNYTSSLQDINRISSSAHSREDMNFTGSSFTLNNNDKTKNKKTKWFKKLLHPNSLTEDRNENKEKKNKWYKKKISLPG